MKSKLKGNIILLITTIAWGSSFVAQRLGMSDPTLSPTNFIAMRTLMGGLVLIPFILFKKQNNKKVYASDDKKYLFIGGIVIGIILCFASVMQTWGMAYPDTSAGKAGFITSLYIIFVPIIGLFLGKKISPIILLCIILATFGMYLLCSTTRDDEFLSRGDFYVLISAILYSLHILTTDYYATKVSDPVKLACIQFFVCGILALLWTIITSTFNPVAIKNSILPILYSGVISCGIGYTLQTVGQKYTDPSSASLIMSLESVFSAISGAIFLNELMTSNQVLGCTLTFIAVIISQIPINSFKTKKKPNSIRVWLLFYILKIAFTIPFKALGTFTTTIFIKIYLLLPIKQTKPTHDQKHNRF